MTVQKNKSVPSTKEQNMKRFVALSTWALVAFLCSPSLAQSLVKSKPRAKPRAERSFNWDRVSMVDTYDHEYVEAATAAIREVM